MNLLDIEGYFNENSYPKEPIFIDEATVVNDPEKFITVVIKTLKANPGKVTYYPYFQLLEKVYHKINGQ